MLEDEDEEYPDAWEARPLHPLDFVVTCIGFLQSVAIDLAGALDHLNSVLYAHRGYLTDQREFRDEVRAELEKIPTPED